MLLYGLMMMLCSVVMAEYSMQDHLLHQCAAQGTIGGMAFALNHGANINAKNAFQATALSIASRHGHGEAVKFLFRHQAQMDPSALLAAVQYGHAKVVQVLLDHGADPNGRDKEGITMLMHAVMGQHLGVIRTLLNQEEGINLQDNGDRTASVLAIDHKVQINAQTSQGLTALMMASMRGLEKVIILLIQHDANVHLKEKKNGNTALVFAAEKGYARVVEFLWKRAGASVHVQNALEQTPLMVAAENGRKMVVQGLLGGMRMVDVKPYVNLRDQFKQTALMLAAEEGHATIVDLLLENGADPRLLNHRGQTALMLAAFHHHTNVMKRLMQ